MALLASGGSNHHGGQHGERYTNVVIAVVACCCSCLQLLDLSQSLMLLASRNRHFRSQKVPAKVSEEFRAHNLAAKHARKKTRDDEKLDRLWRHGIDHEDDTFLLSTSSLVVQAKLPFYCSTALLDHAVVILS